MQPDGHSNVILIIIDTLRQDHLGYCGYERSTSPNIDRLAASSLRFTNAYSQAPWTTPSVGSLLTSRYPTSLGIMKRESPLPQEVPTLAEMLRDAGYQTGAVISNRMCSQRWSFDQGFEDFDESTIEGYPHGSSAAVTERAIELVERYQDGPFFLWVHYFDPHFGYRQHEEHLFTGDQPYQGWIRPDTLMKAINERLDELDADDLNHLVDSYDSEIAYTDHHLGRLLDRLRELALLDSSMIIFTADHGEEFLDHGGLSHGPTLYQEVVKVPLLIKVPGVPPGEIREPVSLLDLVPTVLDWLGLASTELEGRSLLAAEAAGHEEPPRAVLTERAKHKQPWAIIDGELKYIMGRRAGTGELYDLSVDPGEQSNIAGQHPQLVARLEARLIEQINALEPVLTTAKDVQLSPEEAEQLKAIGYAD
jgi:arylsulfatase A-like enzyme